MIGRAARACALAVLPALAAAPGGKPRAAAPPARVLAGPSVVLVSLDGFRADYLDRFEAPNLRAMAARGVRARWLQPVFPSLTFPNHYAIVTGLWPAHHGIVNNAMLDPADGAWFRIGDAAAQRDSRWWLGEPLWVTAERQGVRAATFFWPGSEAAIEGVRPSIFKHYDSTYPDTARVDSVLAWLSLPDSVRPRLVMLYFYEPDHSGHQFGPDAPETRAAVRHVDSLVGRLEGGIARAGLGARVNVIVVSDHGMAPVAAGRTLALEDYLDTADVIVVSAGEVIGVDTRDGNRARVVARLRRAPHLSVWDRDSVPGRLHYGGSPRIPDVVGVMDQGWELVDRALLARRQARPMGGAHGYDPDTAPLMHALFVAEGPAFRSGALVAPFRNIHVYDLICGILGLVPAPNDGSPDSTRAVRR